MRKGILGSLTGLLASAGLALAQTPAPPPQPFVLPAKNAPEEPGAKTSPEPIKTPPSSAPAAAAPTPPIPCDQGRHEFIGMVGRVYGGVDSLLWWPKGQRLPPLATTGPDTSPNAGTLGDPAGTTILFGNSQVDDQARSGFRLTAGYWLDDQQNVGVEVIGFYL